MREGFGERTNEGGLLLLASATLSIKETQDIKQKKRMTKKKKMILMMK